MQSPFFVLLDDAVARQGTLYEHLVHISTIKANELDTLHELLQENWQKQWHSVVWAPYGLGSDIMGLSASSSQAANDNQQQDDELLIFWFRKKTGLNNDVAIQTWLQEQYAPEEPTGLMQLALAQDKNSYIKTIEQVREDIAAGEIYQINYTNQLQFQAYGSAFRLYRKIRAKQPVPYGVLACLPDGKSIQNQPHRQGHNWTLCFSPELFLDIRQDGSIHTEPMKGTVPAFNDGKNKQRAETLRADPKNRAENVMIVDLLRNDLSKIAVPNGVRVDELFKVAQFGPVLQMTTPIHAQARPDTKAGDVFNALFPCGSITGAPKKRSMQLIEQYETRARGLYTGSIGFLAPCQTGLGFYGKLNVVIRTLELTASVTPPPDGKPSQYTQQFNGIMGVGSGIVHDSDPAEEYEECHWKARFLQNLPVDFTLFETMLYDQGQCALLETHIARLRRSAQDLGFHFDEAKTRQDLHVFFNRLHEQNELEKDTANRPCRIKATLHDDGTVNIQAGALDALAPDRQTVVPATQSFPNHDILRRYKTSHRQAYDAQMRHALAQGAFDSLCFNENGYLLEGARSSIFVFYQNQWLTPGLDLDILHSVMRETILQDPEHWLRPFTPANAIPVPEPLDIKEQLIRMEQLASAQKILAVNALRGIIPVSLLKLNDFKDNTRK